MNVELMARRPCLQGTKASKEIERTPKRCHRSHRNLYTSTEITTLPSSSYLLVFLLVLVGFFGGHTSPGLVSGLRHESPDKNGALEDLQGQFGDRTWRNSTVKDNDEDPTPKEAVVLVAQNVTGTLHPNTTLSKLNSSTTDHEVQVYGDGSDQPDTLLSNDTRSLPDPLENSSAQNTSPTISDIETGPKVDKASKEPNDNSSSVSLAEDRLVNTTIRGDNSTISTTDVNLNDTTVSVIQDLSEASGVPENPPAGDKLNQTKVQDISEAVDIETTLYSPDSSVKPEDEIHVNVNSSHTPLKSPLPSEKGISNNTETVPVPSAKPVSRKPKMLVQHDPTVGDFNVTPSTDLAEESEFPSAHFEADDVLPEESEFRSEHFESDGGLIDPDPKSNSGKDISGSHSAKDALSSEDEDEPKLESDNGYFEDTGPQDGHKRKHGKKPIGTLSKPDRDETVISVRKCCGEHEFFSSISNECLPTPVSHFPEYATALSPKPLGKNGSDATTLDIRTGTLQACPGSGSPPDLSAISPDIYRLLPTGSLLHIESGYRYDQENYCLEAVTQDGSVYDPSSLILAFCPKVTVRKCCREDEFFDFGEQQCQVRPPGMINVTDLLTELASDDLNLDTVTLMTATLACHGLVTPELLENTYLNAKGELCAPGHSPCFETSHYCIEHGLTLEGTLMTTTAVCAMESFHKCCELDHMLSTEGCVPRQGHRSALLTQFEETRHAFIIFPNTDDPCSSTYLDGHGEFKWWVDGKGYLLLGEGESQLSLFRYCIDDVFTDEGDVQPRAVTCAQDIDSLLPTPEAVGVDGILGKCCPRGKVISESSNECVPDYSEFEPLEDVHLSERNVSQLIYASHPTCPPGSAGYHIYYFAPATQDHVEMQEDLSLKVVSTASSSEGVYVERTNEIGMLDYCVDAVWDETGAHLARTAVIVCSVEWNNKNPHNEKFIVLPLLLGVSCVFLLATVIVLSCMRVRRGLVTVKKINTLAGRILLSYVVSYLLGSLSLISTMVYGFEENYAACSTLAGMTLFFMLAGFHWNTSICFESLLLTIHVGTSENWRFILHSLLAWGLPGIITIIALTLDAHRNQLPRHVVTLNIGRLNCLTADHLALVLYMYVPISITLAANLCFLVGAKMIRSHQLKRLERGGGRRKPPEGGAAGGRNPQGQNGTATAPGGEQGTGHQRPAQKQHSGMRTHQSRNLTAESVKLALWSGVTWVIDILGWIITRYVYTPNQRWYDYLWYIPSAINSLRGIGIFIILVLTPENRIKLMKLFSSLTKSSPQNNRNSEAHSSSGIHSSQYPNQYSTASSGPLNRNPSTSTTLTHLSTFRSNASGPTVDMPMGMSGRGQVNGNGISNGRAVPRYPFAHSVSQIDMRRDSTTTISMRLASQSSEADDVFEEPSITPSGGDNEEVQGPKVGNGLDIGKRLMSLQSVDEEDVFETPSSDKESTGSTKTIDTTTC